jgi:hypothetical protein
MRLSKVINDAGLGFKPGGMNLTGRDIVCVTPAVLTSYIPDGQFHAAIQDNPPLGTMGMRINFSLGIDFKKNQLLIGPLEQRTPESWKRYISLRECPDFLWKEFI